MGPDGQKQMPKFDPSEYGLFIRADGIRSSVPWKLAEYGDDGALYEEQIQSMAARFEITPDRLRELSRSLGIALDPGATPNLVSVRISVAARRADEEITRAFREIGTAEEKLYFAIRRLEQVDPETAETNADRQRFREAKKAAMESHRQSMIALRHLDKFDKTLGAVLSPRPTDKRYVPDFRRKRVLGALFQFWVDCGHKLSYTTDPFTSERGGSLIDFINAVIPCLSEPPRSLGGETIIRAIKEFCPRSER